MVNKCEWFEVRVKSLDAWDKWRGSEIDSEGYPRFL